MPSSGPTCLDESGARCVFYSSLKHMYVLEAVSCICPGDRCSGNAHPKKAMVLSQVVHGYILSPASLCSA